MKGRGERDSFYDSRLVLCSVYFSGIGNVYVCLGLVGSNFMLWHIIKVRWVDRETLVKMYEKLLVKMVIAAPGQPAWCVVVTPHTLHVATRAVAWTRKIMPKEHDSLIYSIPILKRIRHFLRNQWFIDKVVMTFWMMLGCGTPQVPTFPSSANNHSLEASFKRNVPRGGKSFCVLHHDFKFDQSFKSIPGPEWVMVVAFQVLVQCNYLIMALFTLSDISQGLFRLSLRQGLLL